MVSQILECWALYQKERSRSFKRNDNPQNRLGRGRIVYDLVIVISRSGTGNDGCAPRVGGEIRKKVIMNFSKESMALVGWIDGCSSANA